LAWCEVRDIEADGIVDQVRVNIVLQAGCIALLDCIHSLQDSLRDVIVGYGLFECTTGLALELFPSKPELTPVEVGHSRSHPLAAFAEEFPFLRACSHSEDFIVSTKVDTPDAVVVCGFELLRKLITIGADRDGF